MDGWKMSFLLGFPIFRGYVKLRGGSWWFQIFWKFSPLFGEDAHFESYFSDGLKPPASKDLAHHFFIVGMLQEVCRGCDTCKDESTDKNQQKQQHEQNMQQQRRQ